MGSLLIGSRLRSDASLFFDDVEPQRVRKQLRILQADAMVGRRTIRREYVTFRSGTWFSPILRGQSCMMGRMQCRTSGRQKIAFETSSWFYALIPLRSAKLDL